jgi:uncharacterized membrane protein (Fun14 family)
LKRTKLNKTNKTFKTMNAFAARRASAAFAVVSGSAMAFHMHRRMNTTTNTFEALAQQHGTAHPGKHVPPPIIPDDSNVNSTANQHVRRAGLGALLGFASGYAVKKIGRLFLLVVGLEFIFLQSLVVMDLITVHWDRVGRRTTALTTPEGQRQTENRIVTMLTTNIPFKASFVGAFYGGFRFG